MGSCVSNPSPRAEEEKQEVDPPQQHDDKHHRPMMEDFGGYDLRSSSPIDQSTNNNNNNINEKDESEDSVSFRLSMQKRRVSNPFARGESQSQGSTRGLRVSEWSGTADDVHVSFASHAITATSGQQELPLMLTPHAMSHRSQLALPNPRSMSLSL